MTEQNEIFTKEYWVSFLEEQTKEDYFDYEIAENIANKLKEAINYTRCCETLKDKKGISIEEWLKDNKWEKIRHSTYINEKKDIRTIKNLTNDYISWIRSL